MKRAHSSAPTFAALTPAPPPLFRAPPPKIGGGECSVADDSDAGGPPAVDAETTTGDFCALPEESPCVNLDVAVQEISGPSIGMYYDEACLAGGGGETGCGAGGQPTCRLCFVNRDFWLADFAEERYPDW